MKNKFIRVLSPLTLIVIAILDCSIIGLAVVCVKKLLLDINFYTIIFTIIEAFAIVIGFFVSKEIMSNGVKLDDEKIEFTGLDDNNIFVYKDIEKIETSKDTKASLKKNFVDRYSKVIIYQKDGSVTTIELGLTTVKKLTKIKDEIEKRM